jgi:hypothetical protein
VGSDLEGGGPVAGLVCDSPTHHSTRLGGKLWMYGTTTRSYISAVSDTIALSCAVYFLMCVSVAGQITLMTRSGNERDASQAWDEKYCGNTVQWGCHCSSAGGVVVDARGGTASTHRPVKTLETMLNDLGGLLGGEHRLLQVDNRVHVPQLAEEVDRSTRRCCSAASDVIVPWKASTSLPELSDADGSCNLMSRPANSPCERTRVKVKVLSVSMSSGSSLGSASVILRWDAESEWSRRRKAMQSWWSS